MQRLIFSGSRSFDFYTLQGKTLADFILLELEIVPEWGSLLGWVRLPSVWYDIDL